MLYLTGTQPAAGNGTCGTATLASSFIGASYASSYAYTNLGQTWQGPLNGTGAGQQYLYCDSNHPHQLTGVYPAGTTCTNVGSTIASYSASYDAWGNLSSRVHNAITATLSYNGLDQLVQWDAGSKGQEWYAYDASGQRVAQRTTSGGVTSLTTYAFGLEEHAYDNTGNNTANKYYFLLGGRLVAQYDGFTYRYIMTDGLGSVLVMFDNIAGSAQLLGGQLYGPYGNTRYQSGWIGTNMGFTGQYADKATGLDYYNARYYDPVVGRFVSADTVQDNLHGFDPYAYVKGNPETAIDPTGHWGFWDTVAAAVVVVAAVAVVSMVAVPLLVGGGVLLATSLAGAGEVAAAGTLAASTAAATSAVSAASTATIATSILGGVVTLSSATGIIGQIIGDRTYGRWSSAEDIQDAGLTAGLYEACGVNVITNALCVGQAQFQQVQAQDQLDATATALAEKENSLNAQATALANKAQSLNATATAIAQKTQPTQRSTPQASQSTPTQQSTSNWYQPPASNWYQYVQDVVSDTTSNNAQAPVYIPIAGGRAWMY